MMSSGLTEHVLITAQGYDLSFRTVSSLKAETGPSIPEAMTELTSSNSVWNFCTRPTPKKFLGLKRQAGP